MDAQSGALKAILALANLPMRQIRSVIGQNVSGEIRGLYEHRHVDTGYRKSMYIGIKRLLMGANATAGFLSGATEAGITHWTEEGGGLDSFFSGRDIIIGPKGHWPARGTNIREHLSITDIIAHSNEAAFSMPGQTFSSGLGATVTLTASGGFHVVWDKKLKGGGLKDWHTPAGEMQGMTYGEFGHKEDPFYLSGRQVNHVMGWLEDIVENLINDNKLASSVAGVQAPPEHTRPAPMVVGPAEGALGISGMFPKDIYGATVRSQLAAQARQIYRKGIEVLGAVRGATRQTAIDATSKVLERQLEALERRGYII